MACSNNTTFVMPEKYQIDVNVAASGIIAFFTIVANLMLILVFVCNREVRNVTNAAISFLAFSDFVRGAVVMTMKIRNQLRFAGSTVRPTIEEPICTATAVVRSFTSLFSPMVLALIAVMRYLLIKRWNSKKGGVSKMAFMVIVLILISISAVFSILPLVGVGHYRYSQSHGICFLDWCDDNNIIRTTYYIITMGIIWPMLIIFYSIIFFTYRKYQTAILDSEETSSRSSNDKSRLKRNRGSDDSSLGASCDSDTIKRYQKRLLDDYDQQFGTTVWHVRDSPSDERSQSLADIRLSKQEQRITRLLLLIFLAYSICWLPATVVNIITIANLVSLPIEWYYIIVTMVELMCAIDPILYGLGNRKYWKAFMDIVQC